MALQLNKLEFSSFKINLCLVQISVETGRWWRTDFNVIYIIIYMYTQFLLFK